MENFICSDISFHDEKLSILVNQLKECYLSHQNKFAELCFTVYNIWSYCKGQYWKAKDNEYYNSYKLLEKFGFDKKAISRYKLSAERYIEGTMIGNLYVKPLYFGFTPSKLFELLVLSNDTLEDCIQNKLIRPEMTVKQIREYIKSLKDGTDKAEKVVETSSEIVEEEIPMAYDVSKEYEYSYFEGKSKNQLLNIVWELQKAYQKLLKKSKK